MFVALQCAHFRLVDLGRVGLVRITASSRLTHSHIASHAWFASRTLRNSWSESFFCSTFFIIISVIVSLGHKKIKHLSCCITQENNVNGIDVLKIYSTLLSGTNFMKCNFMRNYAVYWSQLTANSQCSLRPVS